MRTAAHDRGTESFTDRHSYSPVGGSSLRRQATWSVFFTALLWAALGLGRASAATIDDASVCVDAEAFRFSVTLTESASEVIFRIGADNDPFSTPNERIAANFDPVTGEITRQEPVVETFGTPPFDRWVDGPIDDFTIEAVSSGVWQVSGSVPHGPDGFEIGEAIWGVAVRAGGVTVVSGALEVSGCAPVGPVTFNVPFTTRPPRLDGRIDMGEWGFAAQPPQIQLENGSITLFHDQMRLYFLINMREDRTDDPAHQGGADQFWLLFDVDKDGAVTPNFDRRYRLISGTGNLRYETFGDGSGFTFNLPAPSTYSARAEGFGCFFGDGSATFFPILSCDAHRVWELAIDLREIHAAEGDFTARLGLLVQSDLDTVEVRPSNLLDFPVYFELQLDETRIPLPAYSGETPLDRAEIRISQAIQTAANDLPLVKDRATWTQLLFENEGKTGTLANIFISRNGVDMPGSPLAILSYLSLDWDLGFYQDRHLLPLADEWASGDLDISMIVRQPNISTVTATSPQQVSFIPSEMPTYWIVPFNTGTAAAPQMANEDYIRRNELETLATFPVPDIDFVRRPVVVDDPPTQDDAIDVLNTYDQQAVLAWTLGLVLTGTPPFDLPDQIVGVFPLNHYNNIGLSDPIWGSGGSGNGRVSWIYETTLTNLNMPHEVNHNLDTDPSGTWGRHAPNVVRGGCGAERRGPDPQWPYADDNIQEPGVMGKVMEDPNLRGLEPPQELSAETPDFMSYCVNDPVYPSQWISPYRWRNMLEDVFGNLSASGFTTQPMLASLHTTPTAQSTIEEAFYITAQVNVDGSASLDPILRQPGVVRAPQIPGEYALEIHACNGMTLYSKSFGVNFINVEGEPRDSVPIAMVLPDPGGVCAIQLLHEGEVLAEREVTPNAPEVRLLSPNGGEHWTGTEEVRWEASDADGDLLTATLLFSPDGGLTWLPIAGRTTADITSVDSTTLPGSDNARLRVLVTDGVNTAYDDSDFVFTVEPKPPAVTIYSPEDNALLVAGEPVTFRGVSRSPQGNRLPAEDYQWLLDGSGLGLGDAVIASLTEGEHVISLRTTNEAGLTGEATIQVEVLPADTLLDPVGDTEAPGVDLHLAQIYAEGDRLSCEITVASGTAGLPDKGQYSFLLDFHDLEQEAVERCDANGDGLYEDTYRLGSNGPCGTADVGLHFRVSKQGGRCTGPGAVDCFTIETNAEGEQDELCDGQVAGLPAQRCHIVMSTDIESLNQERAAQCADSSADCLPNSDGQARAYAFLTAHAEGSRDRLPDAPGREEPDALSEAVEVNWPAAQ